MSTRYIALVATLIILALVTGCVGAAPPPAPVPPSATPTLPTATSAPPTETLSPTDAPILPTVTPELAAPDESALNITYTCNDGFIIAFHEKKVLIDALFREPRISCYTDPEEVAAMTLARPPFDGVDLILISHGHSDHFDPQIVGTCLQNNPQAVLVSMGSVIDELEKRFSGFDQVQDRVRGFQLAEKESVQMTIHGIDLEIINAPADVPNLGFLIQIGGVTLFHTGDSDSTRETVDLFKSYHLPDKRIDLAFVPWWYLGDEWYHPLVEEGIQAKNYVPMHFAGDDAARMFKAVPTHYPQTILFRQKMQTWVYSPPAPPTTTPVSKATPTVTPVPLTATPVPPTATPKPTATAILLPPLTGSGRGVIAFVSERDGDQEIYIMNADGSDQRRLTNDSSTNGWPNWSPDGKQMAFQSNRSGALNIYLMDVLGGSQVDDSKAQRLTNSPPGRGSWEPAWSSDGKWIAYSAQQTSGSDIFLTNPDGTGRQADRFLIQP